MEHGNPMRMNRSRVKLRRGKKTRYDEEKTGADPSRAE